MTSQKLVREKRPLGKKARAVTNEQGGKHKCREDSMPNPAPPRSGTVSGLKAPPLPRNGAETRGTRRV